jgi:hypothetical protein
MVWFSGFSVSQWLISGIQNASKEKVLEFICGVSLSIEVQNEVYLFLCVCHWYQFLAYP